MPRRRDHLLEARSKAALERGLAAAREGQDAEAVDEFAIYLRLMGKPSDEITRWFLAHYGADASLVKSLVGN